MSCGHEFHNSCHQDWKQLFGACQNKTDCVRCDILIRVQSALKDSKPVEQAVTLDANVSTNDMLFLLSLFPSEADRSSCLRYAFGLNRKTSAIELKQQQQKVESTYRWLEAWTRQLLVKSGSSWVFGGAVGLNRERS